MEIIFLPLSHRSPFSFKL